TVDEPVDHDPGEQLEVPDAREHIGIDEVRTWYRGSLVQLCRHLKSDIRYPISATCPTSAAARTPAASRPAGQARYARTRRGSSGARGAGESAWRAPGCPRSSRDSGRA